MASSAHRHAKLRSRLGRGCDRIQPTPQCFGAGGEADDRPSSHRPGGGWLLGWQRCPAYLSVMSEALAPSTAGPRPDVLHAPQTEPSPWQDLSALEAVGVLSRVTELLEQRGAADEGNPQAPLTPDHLKARLTCRAWRDALPVRQLVALSRNQRCAGLVSSSPFGFFSWPFSPSPGVHLQHADISALRVRPRLCLEALLKLQQLQSLTISLDPEDVAEDGLSGLMLPPSLTTLRLHGVKCSWLEQISQLSRLTVLELHAAPKFSLISEAISSIAPLSRLTNLQSLCVENHRSWSEESYRALQSMTTLQFLSLVGFSRRSLQSLQALSNLRALELFNEPEADILLDCADGREQLRLPPSLKLVTLELNAVNVNGLQQVLQTLRPFRSVLSSAELHACEFDMSTASSLVAFTALKDLYLSGVDAPEEVLLVLRPLVGLETLGLGSIPLTDLGLTFLKSFTRLKSLDGLCHSPGQNGGFTHRALDELVASLPRLIHLSIDVDDDAGWKLSPREAPADAASNIDVRGWIQQHVQCYHHLNTSVTSNMS